MITQIFSFFNDKYPVSDYESTIYKWDDVENKVYSEYISIESQNVELTKNNYMISINNHINQFEYNMNFFSLNKLAVDRSTDIGKKYYKLLKDIYPYDVTIVDKIGSIDIVCPKLKAYLDYKNDPQSSLLISPNIKEVYGVERIVFTIDFKDINEKLLKNKGVIEKSDYIKYDNTIAEIYKYFRIYTTVYSETALMCPKCYKSHYKLKIKSSPLFTNINVYDVLGKHKCPYCEYEGEDDFPTIDLNMTRLIYYLNSRGIKTTACCSGHSWFDYDVYIMFEKDKFGKLGEAGKYYISQDLIDEYFNHQFKFEFYDNGIVCRFNRTYVCDQCAPVDNYESQYDNFNEFSKYACDTMLEIFKWIISGYKMKDNSSKTEEG